jgi:hypothetical protein
MMPTATSWPFGTTAKHMRRPWLRSLCAHWMKRSKPATPEGGADMNRCTSSLDNVAQSEGASETRRSISVTRSFDNTGNPAVQSGRAGSVARSAAEVLASAANSGRNGILSIIESHRQARPPGRHPD